MCTPAKCLEQASNHPRTAGFPNRPPGNSFSPRCARPCISSPLKRPQCPPPSYLSTPNPLLTTELHCIVQLYIASTDSPTDQKRGYLHKRQRFQSRFVQKMACTLVETARRGTRTNDTYNNAIHRRVWKNPGPSTNRCADRAASTRTPSKSTSTNRCSVPTELRKTQFSRTPSKRCRSTTTAQLRATY